VLEERKGKPKEKSTKEVINVERKTVTTEQGYIYIYIHTRANLHPGCRVKFYTQQ
jgi:hypothetical protein